MNELAAARARERTGRQKPKLGAVEVGLARQMHGSAMTWRAPTSG